MLGISARPVVEKVIAPVVARLARGRGHPRHGHDRRHASARSPARSSSSAPGTCSGARSPSRSPSCSTCSTARWPGPAAAARCSAPSSTPPVTGPPTPRSSASLVWWFSGARRQPAAGPAGAALPGARRPHLLHQGARRGRRASPATSASSSARAADPGARSAPGSTGLGVPYALHVALWVLLVGSAVTVGPADPRRPRGAAAGRVGAAGAVTDADRRPGRCARRRHRGGADRRGLRRRLARGPDAARAGGARARSTGPGAGRPAATARAPASCGPTCGWSPVAGCPRPSWPTLTTRALRSYARYWQEAFRLPTLQQRADRRAAPRSSAWST